jgi:hypothetical protein
MKSALRIYFGVGLVYTMAELISLGSGLQKDVKIDQISKILHTRLQELNMLQPKYKLDNELLTYIVNIVEHFVLKSDKIDKKQFVLDFMKDNFSATQEELEVIGKAIEYLHSNKQIKKVSYYKLFKTFLKEWFFPKK